MRKKLWRCFCSEIISFAILFNFLFLVCLCKEGYSGARCDHCSPGYFNYPDCIPCNCSSAGSIITVCDHTGKVGCGSFINSAISLLSFFLQQCPCLQNFAGKRCDQCMTGFYQFPECLACNCDSNGAIGISVSFIVSKMSNNLKCRLNPQCNADGQCNCHKSFDGLTCNSCKENYYNYPLCESCDCNPVSFPTFLNREGNKNFNSFLVWSHRQVRWLRIRIGASRGTLSVQGTRSRKNLRCLSSTLLEPQRFKPRRLRRVRLLY